MCANGRESSSFGHANIVCMSNGDDEIVVEIAVDAELEFESNLEVAPVVEKIFCALPNLDSLPCRSFEFEIGRLGKIRRTQANVASSQLEL